MTYIQKSLGDGERLVALAHFHWLYTARALLALILPALPIAGVFRYADDSSREPLLIAALVLFAVGIIVFLRLMIRKWTTEIGVTSHRFVEKYGALSMRTNEIALPNIEGVKVNQSLMGRILGYGTIRIEGTGVDAVTTPDIADPVGFVRAIQTAKEHVAQRFEQQSGKV